MSIGFVEILSFKRCPGTALRDPGHADILSTPVFIKPLVWTGYSLLSLRPLGRILSLARLVLQNIIQDRAVHVPVRARGRRRLLPEQHRARLLPGDGRAIR